MDNMIERRKHIRESLPIPLALNVSIDSIKGKKAKSSNVYTCVKDISLGGVRFVSLFPLPEHPTIILKLETKIGDNNFTTKGAIAWRGTSEEGLHEYGIKFFINDKNKEILNRLINELKETYLTKGKYPEGSYIYEGKNIYEHLNNNYKNKTLVKR